MSNTHRAQNPQWQLGAGVAAAVVAVVLTGCSADMGVQVQNREAVQTLARQSEPSGSVYRGWRIFQDKCASCHGPAALGSAGAPDLLPRVAAMGPRQFVSLVLKRYDWNNAVDKSSKDVAAQETVVDQVLQRKEPALVMPAWGTEPSVNTHIADLYAYLSARAQGSQGVGRPVQ